LCVYVLFFFFFSSRRRHTRFSRDWSSDVCSSDLQGETKDRIPPPKATTAWRRNPDSARPSVMPTVSHEHPRTPHRLLSADRCARSEERRVGKEGRYRCSP